MFRPLEAFIGLRYLRARRKNQFVSFISLMSLLGVMVGVAALIVVVSVMNGFENELRQRLLSMTAHSVVTGPDNRLADWAPIADKARKDPRVLAAAPYVEIQGMLAREGSLRPALVRGVLPEEEGKVSEIAGFVRQGRLEDLAPGGMRIILGRLLAARLGAMPGDSITLMIPAGQGAGIRLTPRLRSFEVSGVFEVGMEEHDGLLALVHLDDAAAARGWPGEVSGVRLELEDMFVAPAVAETLRAGLPEDYETRDWTQENASYFRAVRIEKTMMSIILFLVVAVAAFNIVATLVMVVTDKRPEIAILRTLGLAPGGVMQVFLIQGLVIGVAGTVLGVGLGVLLALNVETLVPAIEQLFGFQFMPADVYYISSLPSELRPAQVAGIGLLAFLLCALSTLYPSFQAAATHPAEALRYE
jgi:lipoprotein-releasing system permease protein